MNISMKNISLSGFLLASLLLASSAAAQQPAPLDGILRAMDVVPTAEQMSAVLPEPVSMLRDAALDTSRSTYERTRAVTLLSVYPGAESRLALNELLNAADEDVRRLALWTLARTFGDTQDPVLAAQIATFFADPSEAIREEAVRAMRWVDHADAAQYLIELRPTASADLVRIIDHTLERRADRLAAGDQVTR